ncbi:aminotransferase class I/II-fold pyridoxal phosphate-dependent enzyme, partial [Streptomyces sp. NPDC003832]
VGNGSVGVALQFLRAAVRPGDRMVFGRRNFDAHPLLAEMVEAVPVAVPLHDDGEQDLSALAVAASAGREAAVVVLCNPHNPTGTRLRAPDLADFVAGLPDHTLVLLDEAYAEFAEFAGDGRAASLALCERYPNVVLLRTFSKAYGLAGLRVGYGIAQPERARSARAQQLPFGITKEATAAVLASLSAQGELRDRIRRVTAARDTLRSTLLSTGWAVPRSHANILWLQHPQATPELHRRLENAGFLTRWYPGEGLRLTVPDTSALDRVASAVGSPPPEVPVGLGAPIRRRAPLGRDAAPASPAVTSVYGSLDRAAAAAEAGASAAVADALAQAEATDTDDPALVRHFVAGLRARLGGTETGNLYLRTGDVAQIDLFAVLDRHLPLLRASRIANDALLPFLDGRTQATVLALGIGGGGQERDLLTRAPQLRSLTVFGVDVAPGSVRAARSALLAAGADTATSVDYRAVHSPAECLPDEVWESLREAPGPLLVTASFALHHMRDTREGEDSRTVLFRKLRELSPAAVALCEPDSDHHLLPLRSRLANAWHHYGTLFAAIDATHATAREKAAMKRFFGREIQNVIGAADDDRYERHEPASTWMNRFTSAGFRLLPPPPAPQDAVPGFSTVRHATHTELAFKDIPLAAVITAAPDA